jgi:hypothetical protein
VAVPVLEPAGKIFKQYHPPGIPRITLFMLFQHSLNFVIFIQAAIILEPGPSSNRHVALPVPEPAGKILKQYHPPRIPRITLFMMFRHSLVIFIQTAVILETGPGGNRHVAVPVPELAGNFLNNIIHPGFQELHYL